MPEMKKFKRSEDMLGATIGDELLMMSIEKGSYFSLNTVAARIWELLEQPMNQDELVAQLLQEYNVPSKTCQEEVEKFIAALRERGMLA
ncbi:PqqD family protein [Methylomonas fluvii]|uniref:PqqD family protein n=1 Tax=Methylomonas fluvii TaxID=1854564 RepID=A0ABR9DH63_9GAMM|nr:PqqD family protein [Methylomonas fluvii]MBD9362444.1 PqqD family protein [Methylomonas fluvii]